MLVLSRKVNESICIGGDLIRIMVVSIHGDRVKLGIEAPKDVTVHRHEIEQMIQYQKKKEKGGEV